MKGNTVRAVIAGASTVLGRELADQLSNAPGFVYDIVLADADAGHVTAAGDEALVTAPLELATFEAADIVFCTGAPATIRELSQPLREQGTLIVDLTGALSEEAGVVVLAPGAGQSHADLATNVVIAAHPATVMLLRLGNALSSLAPEARLVATVFEPASQAGHAGMDELHQQTVALLSFHSLPKETYDAQVAFTLTDRLGPASGTALASTESRVRGEMRALTANAFTPALQWLHAPVFHGYTASVWATVGGALNMNAVSAALSSGGFEVLTDDEHELSNQSATGQAEILIRCHADDARSDGAWFWMAADNLQLAARTAIDCAGELLSLRPRATVQ